jgi:hypothetical protein
MNFLIGLASMCVAVAFGIATPSCSAGRTGTEERTRFPAQAEAEKGAAEAGAVAGASPAGDAGRVHKVDGAETAATRAGQIGASGAPAVVVPSAESAIGSAAVTGSIETPIGRWVPSSYIDVFVRIDGTPRHLWLLARVGHRVWPQAALVQRGVRGVNWYAGLDASHRQFALVLVDVPDEVHTRFAARGDAPDASSLPWDEVRGEVRVLDERVVEQRLARR